MMKRLTLLVLFLPLPFLLWAGGGKDSSNNEGDIKDAGERHLLDMIQGGNIEEIEKTLNLNVDLEYSDENGLTALHAAAEIGNTQLTSVLLRRGVAINPQDNTGRTPLYIAVEKQHSEVISILKGFEADPSVSDENGQSPATLSLDSPPAILSNLFNHDTVNIPLENQNTLLHIAANRGLPDHVSALIEIGAKIKEKNSDGHTSLDMALSGIVNQNNVECAAILLRNGAIKPTDDNWVYITEPLRTGDYDIRLDSDLTALHLATEKNHEGMLKYLLSEGADVDARDQAGTIPLHIATRKGYQTITTILIDHGAKINSRDYSGNTPLHEALTTPNSIELVELLIKNGSDINMKDSTGRTPLHLAVYLAADVEVAQLLIDNGAEIDIRDMQGDTPLLLAIKDQNQELSQLFLSENADIFAKNNQNLTPALVALRDQGDTVSWFFDEERLSQIDNEGKSVLHHALSDATRLENLNTFLESNADPNLRDYNGETPLHIAVKLQLLDHAAALIAAGSNLFIRNNADHSPVTLAFDMGNEITLKIFLGHINIEDQWGNTPLYHAIEWEYLEIIDVLLTAGADPNHKNKQGETPLHKAVLSENLNFAMKLIEANANPDVEDALGRTALHIAVKWESTEMVRLLASREANINAQNRAGHTPLHMAASLEKDDISEWLLNFGASPNTMDKNGRTPLFIAAENNRVDTVKLLATSKANFSSRDNEGRTALHAAILNNAYDGAICLIERGADIFAMDVKGLTPFDLLLEAEEAWAATIMIPKVINRQNNQGNSPLHLAVLAGADQSFIEQLIVQGADKIVRNAQGQTPYDLAVKAGNDGLSVLLE